MSVRERRSVEKQVHQPNRFARRVARRQCVTIGSVPRAITNLDQEDGRPHIARFEARRSGVWRRWKRATAQRPQPVHFKVAEHVRRVWLCRIGEATRPHARAGRTVIRARYSERVRGGRRWPPAVLFDARSSVAGPRQGAGAFVPRDTPDTELRWTVSAPEVGEAHHRLWDSQRIIGGLNAPSAGAALNDRPATASHKSYTRKEAEEWEAHGHGVRKPAVGSVAVARPMNPSEHRGAPTCYPTGTPRRTHPGSHERADQSVPIRRYTPSRFE